VKRDGGGDVLLIARHLVMASCTGNLYRDEVVEGPAHLTTPDPITLGPILYHSTACHPMDFLPTYPHHTQPHTNNTHIHHPTSPPPSPHRTPPGLPTPPHFTAPHYSTKTSAPHANPHPNPQIGRCTWLNDRGPTMWTERSTAVDMVQPTLETFDN
jgi:hypothetical protein